MRLIRLDLFICIYSTHACFIRCRNLSILCVSSTSQVRLHCISIIREDLRDGENPRTPVSWMVGGLMAEEVLGDHDLSKPIR